MFIELLSITQISFAINYCAQTDNPVLKSLIFKFIENKNFQNKLIAAKDWVDIEITLNTKTIKSKIKEIENDKLQLNSGIIELILGYKQLFLYTIIYSFFLMFLGSIESIESINFKLVYFVIPFVNSKFYIYDINLCIFMIYIIYFIYQISCLKKWLDDKILNGKWFNVKINLIIFYIKLKNLFLTIILFGISILLCCLMYWFLKTSLLTATIIFTIFVILSLFIAYFYVYYRLYIFNKSKIKDLVKKFDELDKLRQKATNNYNDLIEF